MQLCHRPARSGIGKSAGDVMCSGRVDFFFLVPMQLMGCSVVWAFTNDRHSVFLLGCRKKKKRLPAALDWVVSEGMQEAVFSPSRTTRTCLAGSATPTYVSLPTRDGWSESTRQSVGSAVPAHAFLSNQASGFWPLPAVPGPVTCDATFDPAALADAGHSMIFFSGASVAQPPPIGQRQGCTLRRERHVLFPEYDPRGQLAQWRGWDCATASLLGCRSSLSRLPGANYPAAACELWLAETAAERRVVTSRPSRDVNGQIVRHQPSMAASPCKCSPLFDPSFGLQPLAHADGSALPLPEQTLLLIFRGAPRLPASTRAPPTILSSQ